MQYIYNGSLRLTYFPYQWKIPTIILIPKHGKYPNRPESYRPISLSPVLGKFFEKLLLSRLLPILDENKLIPEHQFVFRKKHAATKQTLRVST